VTLVKCKIREGCGISGGQSGYVVSTCEGVPKIKLVLIGKEIHYINEDQLLIEEQKKNATQRFLYWAKCLLQRVGTFIPVRQRRNNNRY
jgi:hypothetical protein